MTDYHVPMWEQREHKRQVRIIATEAVIALIALAFFLWLLP